MPIILQSPTGSGGSGGLTLVGKQTLAADAATVSVAAIPGTYGALQVLMVARSTKAALTDTALFTFNSDTGSNYTSASSFTGSSSGGTSSNNAANFSLGIPGASADANEFGMLELTLPQYASTSVFKACSGTGGNKASAASFFWVSLFAVWQSTVAITSVSVTTAASNFKAGSSLYVYGLSA